MARCFEIERDGKENPANKIFPAKEIRNGLKNNVREVTELNQSVLCLQDCCRMFEERRDVGWEWYWFSYEGTDGTMSVLKHWITNDFEKLLNQNVLSKISTTKFLPISQRSVSYYYLVIHNCGNSLDTFCRCATVEKVAYHKYLRVVIDNCIRRSELSEVLVHR